MKTVITIFVFLFFSGINLFAQPLTGNKSIPGNYSTIADAIADLDTQGVGTGGVIFNVMSGHTEVASNLVISIPVDPPTESNPVVFQASFPGGRGANPLITAAPGSSATLDGIIKLSGADYITFDGIDLLDPASNTGDEMMEWGYALLRKDSSDGSQHNVIRNCNITLQKINTGSIGIYLVNRDLNGGQLGANNPLGLNSYNRFYGNSISNVYRGIILISQSTNRDVNNEVGVNGFASNSITNWGGSSITCEGVRCEGQINLKISNNIINGGTGSSGSGAVYGILATLFGATGLAASYEISYNTVTVNASVTSQGTFAIRALATGDTVRIHHNIVEECNVVQNTTTFNGIIHDPSGTTNAAFIYNNIVRNNTHSGTGLSNLLGQSAGTVSYLSIHSNQVYGNQKTGISGTMNCIRAATASLECDSNEVYNNSMPNSSGASSSFLYGYINSGSPVRETVYNNHIYNLTVGGSNTSNASLVVGIRSNANAATEKEIYGNTIHGLSGVSGTSTTGGVFGIYSSLSASAKIHSNKIYDITNTAANSLAGGCWVSSGFGIEIYNNFISEIKAPNSTNLNGVIGINITSTTANSTVGVYYNSVYLTASGGSTFGSSAISSTASATVTSGALTLIDNILLNLSAPGSTSGSSVVIRRSSTNLGNFSSSDYNDLYAGTPSSNRLIFFDGTNSDQTLAEYQVRVSPKDANSKSVPVNFVDPTIGDLHLTGSSIGDLNLVGIPVAGITTDYDGQTRSALHPYKGADESTPFVFPVLDLTLNLEACSPMQDTVAILIRNATAPYAVVDSVIGYLSPSGTVSLSYKNALNGVNYYLVIRHRNSIETWSKSGGEVFTAGSLSYDFTTAASQAFDANQVLVGSEYSVFTGDVNQDGIVDLTDLVIISNDANAFLTGYVVTDLNCNSIVDLTDLLFAFNNSSLFVSVKRP